MNNQEAIQALKQINLKRVHPFYSWEEMKEVRDIAIVAIDKQIPKKPKDELKIEPVVDNKGAYVDADVTVYLVCPNCGEMVGIDDMCDRFCQECGQAIDGSDNN